MRSGGKEIVRAGGTTNATVISGGLVEVMSGAYVSGRLFTFAGGGALQLDRSAAFNGQVAGFAVPDRIDLLDIAFAPGTTKASFTEAGSHTSGTLAVTDGAHTAKLALLGSYVTSQFHLASDGHGGTLVTDPPTAGGVAQTTFAYIAIAPVAAGQPRPADGSPAAPVGNAALSLNAAPTGGAALVIVPQGGYLATLSTAR